LNTLRWLSVLCVTLALPRVDAQESRMPDEYRTLITAYAVGRISVEDLRGVCRWAPPGPGLREDLAYARRQNIQFCDGYLAGALEFSQLDAEALSKLAGGDPVRNGFKCKPTSVPALRSQLLSAAQGDTKRPADEALLSVNLGCGR
jgi:hypothetical protein